MIDNNYSLCHISLTETKSNVRVNNFCGDDDTSDFRFCGNYKMKKG